jgi:short-subunit dehydrogenase involved in D-alanine esterification of teichoic acids
MTTNYSGARRLAQEGCSGMLVTGASEGIGRALALQLARAGVPVVAVARNSHRLDELARAEPRVIPLSFDLAKVDGMGDLAERAVGACPGLMGVIHNAAIQRDLRFDDAALNEDSIREEVAVDLLAPLLLTRHLLPTLQRREKAWVITLGSVLAIAPRPTAAVYSASKAGLESFSRAMRLQSRGTGVRFVHAVLPLVDTAMTAGRGSGKISPDEAADKLLRAVARGAGAEVFLGKARAVPWLRRLAPALLGRMMARS